MKDLQGCQVFTPLNTVAEMLDEIGYNKGIYDKKIIDNACGDGNFLVQILERYIKEAIELKVKSDEIKTSIEKNIIGCDLDLQMIAKAKNRLTIKAAEYGLKDVNWNITEQDGLFCDGDGTFDYVAGNPPYVAYKDLKTDTRELTKTNFITCKLGKFDYSYAFIEKGINLLKQDGKMIYITPSNMFKTAFGKTLREYIKPYLVKIIECSSLNIFGKVMTSPAITIYEKSNRSNVIAYKEYNDKNSFTEKIIEKELLRDKWNFTDYVNNGTRRFGDSFKVANCIATLLNNVFIKNCGTDDFNALQIEKDILRIAKSPRTERYNVEQKIIFPYYYDNCGALVRYSEDCLMETFPNAYEYLKANKTALAKRDSDSSAKWYEFGRSQALTHLNQEKLLVSTIITKEVLIYRLAANEVPYSGLYIIPRGNQTLDSAITILKSNNFYKYLLSKGIKVNGESIRISSKDIEEYYF